MTFSSVEQAGAWRLMVVTAIGLEWNPGSCDADGSFAP
jgi:hypothetical protein